MLMKEFENKKKCDYCGEEINEDDLSFKSLSNKFICNNCIEMINDFKRKLNGEEEYSNFIKDTKDIKDKEINNLYPKDIYNNLSKYVVGQDKAKKILSVAVYNHYKKIKYNSNSNKKMDLEKSNIILVGPTGSGKTLLIKTLAKYLNIPFAIADANSFTEAGFVGEDVENCLRTLIENADYNIKKAQYGIIYIDEIDKLAKGGESANITRSVGKEGVQQSLLKIVEGTVVEVAEKGQRKNPLGDCYTIDTSNILFIIGGAFDGIENFLDIKNEEESHRIIGFGNRNTNKESNTEKNNNDFIFNNINTKHLKEYGMIPEFIGRFPIICPLQNITQETLKKILTEPKDSIIKQFKELYQIDDIDLEFEENALDAIAEKAYKKGTGARSLRAIIEDILLNCTFNVDSKTKKIIIDKSVILNKSNPKIIEREEQKQESC